MAKNKKRKQLETKRRKFENKSQRSEPINDNQMSSSVNPFEFHRNKVKHNIIGRKLAKNEFGNKGVSRNRAFNKRKNTLLEEYKSKHKSGKGVQDLRNKDNQMIDYRKQQIQLNDNSLSDKTLLTHKGKQLNDFIDDFVGSDDEDIDLFNRPEFVESAHFGGDGQRPKSANEVLDQIMDEKREKQAERAANVELTKQLDSEWSSIKNILRHKGVNHEITNNTNEDFDILLKQLKFDNQSRPVVDLKSVIQPKEITSKEEIEVIPIEKSVETLFKEMVESFELQNDWSKILISMKNSTNNLFYKLSEESIEVLVEKYQTMIETKSTLNANNLGLLLIGNYFKQTKLIVKLILIQMLSKIKLKSFKEIAVVLLINKVLLITSNGKYIPEVFNSISNIIRLTQKSSEGEEIPKRKSNLDLHIGSIDGKVPDFCVKYVFDQTFDNFEKFSENQIKAMLLIQALILTEDLFDNYSSIPSFNELISEIKNICPKICENCSEDIKVVANRVLLKLSREQPKTSVSESRPKPFILPMFEPKFDDKSNDKNSSKKKLVKKYNRELKGAKRELRKDTTFMRNTWVNEIQTNDRRRKDKVKQIMGDLAQQNGTYKKKK